ncbi:6-phosphogluconolactonase [Pararhizobium haloflavum]|uniref:6-phosphogluconolactonase n=1 Tax=Pararhizobium haloflavum TaxID=2037914 RepID=UPI000C1903F6|nr:6-phosphogluconolactonase [Pararhizobium haloflavum]
MSDIAHHDFADRDALAAALAGRIAETLDRAIAERGRATLAVSGGSTPHRLFQELSTRELAWDRVTVTLVDERFVPETDERSNQRLVVERLMQNNAARASFVPLYNEAPTPHQAADRASAVIAGLPRPFDAIILGMGNDGHTASFFAGGDNLDEALSEAADKSVIAMTAPGAEEARLTLTFPAIADARFLALHIEGAEKKQTLARAQTSGAETEMPVRAVLHRAATPVEIYWAP